MLRGGEASKGVGLLRSVGERVTHRSNVKHEITELGKHFLTQRSQ